MEESLIDLKFLLEIIKKKKNLAYWIKQKTETLEIEKEYFKRKEIIECGKNLKREIEKYYVTPEIVKKICLEENSEISLKLYEEIKDSNDSEINKILQMKKESVKQKERIEDIVEIKIEDEEYPELLKKIKKPPQKIYAKGNLQLLKENNIAVVGSRKYSIYGQSMCKKFVEDLVNYNLNIVSGIAIGIDACAHKSCLNAGGKTIVVLPCGLKNIYPKQNQKLYDEIIKNDGLIISEYEPDEKESSDHFRERNRIVAGLAIGTLVIEARRNSGSGITVRNTLEQGKKAFCIPCSLENSRGIGSNIMIRDGKAKLVIDVEDIIKEYPELNFQKKKEIKENISKTERIKEEKVKEDKKEKKAKPKEENKVNVDEEFKCVYEILTETPISINEICKITQKSVSEVTSTITMLQLEELIEEVPGKKYKKK